MDDENDYINEESSDELENEELEEDFDEEEAGAEGYEGGGDFSYNQKNPNQDLVDKLKELKDKRQNEDVTGNRNKQNKKDDSKSKGGEKASEKAGDKASEKAGDKAGEKASEKAGEKASEKAAEKTGEKAAEKAGEKAAEKAGEKAAEKAAVKTAEKTAGKGLTALKIKILFWVAVVIVAIVGLIGTIALIVIILENLFGGLVSFFGISEVSSSEEYNPSDYEKDGVITDTKYSYAKDTCNLDNYKESECLCEPGEEGCRNLNHEEMIKVLKNDDRCHIDSGWYSFLDDITSIFTGDKFTDECQLLRYVRGKIQKYEDDYSNYDLKLDKGLVLSTILSTYDNQYKDSKSEEEEELVDGINHYKILANIIDDGLITKDDVDDIITSTFLKDLYPYYKYEDGSCIQYDHEDYKFSLEKWKIYMRYGYDSKELGTSKSINMAGKITTDITGSLTSINGTGWEYSRALNQAWNQSDEECRSESFFIDRDMTELLDLSVYMNKINNLDDFVYEDLGSGSVITDKVSDSVNVTLDYRAGFVYNKFTMFKKAIDDGYVKYDKTLTPKQMERKILNVVDRKSQINSSLYYEDNKSYYFDVENLPDDSDMFFWPIGSDEVTYTEEGISFALGEPARTNISSKYGMRKHPKTGENKMHNGIDIPGAEGKTNVIASKSGKVVKINNNCTPGNDSCGGGYGNYIKVSHEDGNYTLYAHLHKNSITVKVNDEVMQGQIIAKVGNTGNSTGPHLHFEVRINASTPVDPLGYVDPENPRPVGAREIVPQRGNDDKNTMCLTLLNSNFSENATIALMINAYEDSGFNSKYEVSNLDGTKSYGLFGWRGEEKIQGLKNYCEQKSCAYDSVDGQLNYLIYSFYTNGVDASKAYQNLMSDDLAYNMSNNFCILYDKKLKEEDCKRRTSNNIDAISKYVKNGCSEEVDDGEQ